MTGPMSHHHRKVSRMNYMITYLAGGKRRLQRLEAADAAAAVASLVEERRRHPTCSFELLSVLPFDHIVWKQATGKPAQAPF